MGLFGKLFKKKENESGTKNKRGGNYEKKSTEILKQSV